MIRQMTSNNYQSKNNGYKISDIKISMKFEVMISILSVIIMITRIIMIFVLLTVMVIVIKIMIVATLTAPKL